MREVNRVLKPGGTLFFTEPFLWPLHEVPHDACRYTPFALERSLTNSGFKDVDLKALGGWDANLAQMIGLWAPAQAARKFKRGVISVLGLPLIRYLNGKDVPRHTFHESAMITGIRGARRQGRPHLQYRHRHRGSLEEISKAARREWSPVDRRSIYL